MALIHMNCPGCGAALRAREHDYICEYCGSIVLRLPEKDGTVGATGLTADAFRRRLQESSRIFTVRMEQPPESDIDAKILAGKLERAESSLREGKAYAAGELLRGVPDTVFRAARLRFLAETGARDETELSHYAGDITILRHYAEMMAAADSGTRETYGYIAELCRQNVQIQESIRKGHELLHLGQTEAALEYAEQTVERYGMYARAWELLIAARCCASESYNPYADLPYMEACPDAELTVTGGERDAYGVPRRIAQGIAERCGRIRRKEQERSEWLHRYLIRPLAVAVGIGILILFWFWVGSCME